MAIHRSRDHPRCNQRILCQPGDEGLRAPFSKRRSAVKPLTLEAASAQTGEIGFDGGFVNKDQPVRFLAQPWQAAGKDPRQATTVAPDVKRDGHVPAQSALF
jgi:hypothetical protein